MSNEYGLPSLDGNDKKDDGTNEYGLPSLKVAAKTITDTYNGIKEKMSTRSPAAIAQEARVEDIDSMSWGEQAMVAAGRETDKLLTGAADIGDFALDAMSGGESSGPINRTIARRKDQAEKDRLYEDFQNNSAVGTNLVGGMIPYLATGAGTGPIAAKQASVLSKGASMLGSKAGSTVGKFATDLAARLAGRQSLTGKMARKAQKEIIEPLATRAARIAKQPKLTSPWGKTLARSASEGSTAGAIEAGIHYDDDMTSGAVAGGLGGAAGAILKPWLSKAPDFYGKGSDERRIVEWFKDQGGMPTPGVDTGSRSMLKFENEMKATGDTADFMGQNTLANQQVKNEVAYGAMGVPKGRVQHMTVDKLNDYVTKIGKEYDKMETNSSTYMTKEERGKLASMKSALEKNKSKGGKKALAEYKEFSGRISRTSKANGEARTLTGKEFMEIRTDLKASIDTAYKNGNLVMANALGPMLKVLDDSMTKGIRRDKGRGTVNRFKKLNERYAMSKLLRDKGMDVYGNVDVKRLSNHLRENDMDRLLLEKGGKIKGLQKLVKYEDLEHRGPGGTGRSGIKNSAGLGLGSLLATSHLGRATGLGRVATSLYNKGYPAKHGLLGMAEDGTWSSDRMAGAAARSNTSDGEQGNFKDAKSIEEYLARKKWLDSL